MGAWIELFRSLGQALIELLQAELAVLRDELAASGKRLAIGLALLGAAAVVGFWVIALVLYTAIQVLALWLPLWGAAATVTGFFVLLAAVLAGIGAARLKGLESPTATLGRRVRDHGDWWSERLLAPADEDGDDDEEDEER